MFLKNEKDLLNFLLKRKVILLALVVVAIVSMVMEELHVPAPVGPFLSGWHLLVAAQARKRDIMHSSKTQQKRKRHAYYDQAFC